MERERLGETGGKGKRKIKELNAKYINQKQVCKDLNGKKQGDRIFLNSEDSIKFWSDIWSVRKEHNQKTEWLKGCRKQFENLSSMEKVEKGLEMVKMQCRKMPNLHH